MFLKPSEDGFLIESIQSTQDTQVNQHHPKYMNSHVSNRPDSEYLIQMTCHCSRSQNHG